MSELESLAAWQGLLTVPSEQEIPLSPDTLSGKERVIIAQSAEAIVLDIQHPTPLPIAQDVFLAEPPHPAERSIL